MIDISEKINEKVDRNPPFSKEEDRCVNALLQIIRVNSKCLPIKESFLKKDDEDFKKRQINIAIVNLTTEKIEKEETDSNDNPFSYRYPGKHYEYHLEQFKESLKIISTQDFKADFICMNELAYPTGFFDDEVYKKQKEELDCFLINYAKNNKSCVIAGSYHGKSDFLNKTPIYHLYDWIDSKGHDITNNPACSYKLNSATSAGEFIRTPSMRELKSYQTPYGNFVVLICLDSYDASVVFKLTSTNVRNRFGNETDRQKNPLLGYGKTVKAPVQFIFVPSMNPIDIEAHSVCKEISFISNSVVIYSNCKSKREKRQAVFIAGEDMSTTSYHLNDKVISDEYKEINFYSIPYEHIMNSIRNVEKDYSDDFKAMMGIISNMRVTK